MWRKVLFLALLGVASNVWAAGKKDVMVENAWARETVPGQTSVSVQLSLTVTKSGKLVDVSSPWAKAGEMQRLYPSGGQIKMISIKKVPLQRGKAIEFGDRSVTLMLTGLKQPLKVGDKLPVSLTIAFADGNKATVDVQAEVKALELSYKHYTEPEVHDHR